MVDWTKLPRELWGEIGKRLMSQLDVIRFKSVCKQWRSSLPYQNRFPLWIPPLPDDTSCDNSPYFLTEVNIYSNNVESETNPPKRVLMEFDELEQGSNFHPFAFVPLEAAEASFLYHMLSCQGTRLSFVAKAYRLGIAIPRSDSVELKWSLRMRSIANRVEKTVLISSNANSVDHASYALACDDLSVVVRFTKDGKLALLRLRGSQHDPNWDWVTGFCTLVAYDITTYKGQLCVIDCLGTTFLMDYHSLQMTQFAASPLSEVNLQTSMRLFNANGELHMVTYVNLGEPKVVVKVFKLIGRLRKWVEVDNTGNQLLFRGHGYTVSIPRDVLTSNYGSWVMKHKGWGECGPVSLVLPQDHRDDEDGSSYCFIGFKERCTPWFLGHPASTRTTSSIVLTLYEKYTVGRTNVNLLITRPPSLH